VEGLLKCCGMAAEERRRGSRGCCLRHFVDLKEERCHNAMAGEARGQIFTAAGTVCHRKNGTD